MSARSNPSLAKPDTLELRHRYIAQPRFGCHIQFAVEDENRLPRLRLNLHI